MSSGFLDICFLSSFLFFFRPSCLSSFYLPFEISNQANILPNQRRGIPTNASNYASSTNWSSLWSRHSSCFVLVLSNLEHTLFELEENQIESQEIGYRVYGAAEFGRSIPPPPRSPFHSCGTWRKGRGCKCGQILQYACLLSSFRAAELIFDTTFTLRLKLWLRGRGWRLENDCRRMQHG